MGRSKHHNPAAKNVKLWSNLYAIILLIGILSLVSEIYIYRKTFIDLYVPVLIIIIPSAITYWLMQNRGHYRRVQVSSRVYFPLILWAPSVGFITSFLFLARNYHFADSGNSKVHEYRIKAQTVTKGRKVVPQPLVTIDCNGEGRVLVFPSDYVIQTKRSGE